MARISENVETTLTKVGDIETKIAQIEGSNALLTSQVTALQSAVGTQAEKMDAVKGGVEALKTLVTNLKLPDVDMQPIASKLDSILAIL